MSMTNRTSRSHPGPTVTVTTSMTSCSIISTNFTQRPNMEMETPKHKTLNNALVTTNEVLSITWKFSVNPLTYTAQKQLKITGSFYLRDRNWKNQHTRMTLRTPRWVYKPGNHPIVIRSQLSLLVVPVARSTAS